MYINQTVAAPSQSILKNMLHSFVQVLGVSFFLALCAQISIPLYFTPVPLSGQTFGVMLIGATMGWRLGVLSVLAYLSEAFIGLPVLAGGAAGAVHFVGPTAGYLAGFVAQVFLIGFLIEKVKTFQTGKVLSILILSSAIQLSLGALYLSVYIGIDHAFMLGVAPFIVGEILKALAVTAYLKSQTAS